MNFRDVRAINVLSALSASFGAAGMVFSYLFLCLPGFDYVVHGTAGFLAGSVLVGAGLVSLAMMSSARGPVDDAA